MPMLATMLKRATTADDPQRPDRTDRPPPFQPTPDVGHGHRAGQHQKGDEVTEVPRRDVPPQHQGGPGAAGGQQQQTGQRHLPDRSGSERGDQTPELRRNSSGDDAGRLAVRYRRSKSTPASAGGGSGRQGDEGEHRGEAQAVGPQIGQDIGRHEDDALLGVVVGGEELASVGVHVRPHLL